MKINKFAIFALVICLNVSAAIVYFKDLPPVQLKRFAIYQTPQGYAINLDNAIQNLKPEVRNYFVTNGFRTQGDVLVAKINEKIRESVGIELYGNDFTINIETAKAVLNPVSYNSLKNEVVNILQ